MFYSSKPNPQDVGSLLSFPTDENVELERKSSNVSESREKFRLKNRNFLRQYAHLYSERLLTMRPTLELAAKNKWGTDILLDFVQNIV